MRSHTDLSYQPSQLAHTPDKPSSAHKRLEVFLGTWKADGIAAPNSPSPGRMRTEDTYEWLPGAGFFLVQRGHLQINDEKPTQHIWILGYDAPNDTYFVNAFDGIGDYRIYRLSLHERTWMYSGEYERGTLTFGEDGRSFRAFWEQTKDGSNWEPLCDIKAVNVILQHPIGDKYVRVELRTA